jgi:hypothetical protein
VLVVDKTGDVKKGAHTVSVQRQYTGTARRIENAQVAVYLVYADWRGTRRRTGSCTSRARGRAMRTAAGPWTVRPAAGGAAELVNAEVGTHGVLHERHQRDLH